MINNNNLFWYVIGYFLGCFFGYYLCKIRMDYQRKKEELKARIKEFQDKLSNFDTTFYCSVCKKNTKHNKLHLGVYECQECKGYDRRIK